VANTAPPSIRSSTRFAPRVSQWSSTIDGALHGTGVRGPVKETMRGPVGVGPVLGVIGVIGELDELGETVVGVVVVTVDVVEAPSEVAVDELVDPDDGRLECRLLLLHAVRSTTTVTIATESSRGRRTPRS
jgi:hypothetical protein